MAVSDKVACMLCRRTFSGPEAVERLEVHEARDHAPTPAPADAFQEKALREDEERDAKRYSVRADLEALRETMDRLAPLAAELGYDDIFQWARKHSEVAARWALRLR